MSSRIARASSRTPVTSFVPTATMSGHTDSDGNPIVRSGTTDATGTFSIPFLDEGEYMIGHSVADFGTHRLVFAASATPLQVMVGADEVVGGVTFNVIGATCEASD